MDANITIIDHGIDEYVNKLFTSIVEVSALNLFTFTHVTSFTREYVSIKVTIVKYIC